MTKKAAREADTNNFNRFLLNSESSVVVGFCLDNINQRHSKIAVAQAGKYSSEENFDNITRPPANPNITLFRVLGLLSQLLNVTMVNKNMAVRAMSVVARPACASTGGNVVNIAVANTAMVLP